MLVELSPGIKVVRPQGKAMFPYSNSLYIDDGICVMIDAGAGGGAYQDIQTDKVDLLLLTHNHFDHVNGISFFENARILASEMEAPGYTDPEIYASYAGYELWEELMDNPRQTRFGSISAMPEDVPVNPGFHHIELGGHFHDGEIFDLGNNRLQAVYLPGHSHGHFGFFIQQNGILFSADIDLSPYGPWYGGLFSDIDQLVDSVNRIIELDPAILVTSHRRVFYKGQDDITGSLKAYLAIAMEREQLIWEALQTPQTREQLLKRDYISHYRQQNEYTVFWTRMMILKHIESMSRRNIITCREDGLYRRV